MAIRTTNNASGVQGIVDRARKYNSEIGKYDFHLMDTANYFVRLSNGRLVIPIEVAQDQEVSPSHVSEGVIESIADSFPRTEVVRQTEPLKQYSLWSRLLRFFGIN